MRYKGCQSGSGSCPAPGAIPFAPGARVPSTANEWGVNELKAFRMAFSSMHAEDQAEQQRAQRQRYPQRFKAAQLGVRVALGGFDFRHRLDSMRCAWTALHTPSRRWRRHNRARLPLAYGKTQAVAPYGLRRDTSHSTLRTPHSGASHGPQHCHR